MSLNNELSCSAVTQIMSRCPRCLILRWPRDLQHWPRIVLASVRVARGSIRFSVRCYITVATRFVFSCIQVRRGSRCIRSFALGVSDARSRCRCRTHALRPTRCTLLCVAHHVSRVASAAYLLSFTDSALNTFIALYVRNTFRHTALQIAINT